MLAVDDCGEGEERGQECERWNEKREKYGKSLTIRKNETLTV